MWLSLTYFQLFLNRNISTVGINVILHEICPPPRDVTKPSTLRCVITQKSADLVYIAAEAWNHLSYIYESLCKRSKNRLLGLRFCFSPAQWANHFARSPFVTLLSRRAQYGRWSSFGKRVWFTESHTVLMISFLLVSFTQFILDIK